ncbi:MAG: hypothetical protein IH999_01035 [Proteobacteria bacterium]|nr:hypothetical protein [Pseudomonadota bacterium]
MSFHWPFESVEYLPEDEIKRILGEIADSDLRTTDFELLKKTLTRLAKGLVLEAPIYHPGLTLYRGRLMKTRPETVCDLAYPPAHLVTDFERANTPKQPMFYLNSLRNAVFFELRPEPGDCLAIGYWEVIEKLRMFPVGYSRHVFEQRRSSRSMPKFGPSNHSRLQHPSNILLEEFFAEQFTKEVPREQPWQFKISAAIAENRLSLQEVDGIMYPTVAMRCNSDNFALRPTAARKLTLKKAEYVRVDLVEEFSFKITVLDTATEFPNGRITWKGKPKWTLKRGEELKLVVENGKLRAYDVDGKLREYD